MELSYMQISRQRVIVPERPSYLFFGRERALMEEALTKLVAGTGQTCGGDPDVQALYGDAATSDLVLSELASPSLLAAGKVVVVREAQRMKWQDQTRLAEAIPRLGSGAILVLMAGEPAYDPKTRKKKLLHEKLEAALRSAACIVEFPPIRDQDAEQWVMAGAREAGIRLEPAAAARMVLLAGADLLRLRNELAKVIGYAGTSKAVTTTDIDLVVSPCPEATIFELIDAVGDRKPERALGALKILLDSGEAEQRILALIARQIRLIWQAKYLAECGYLKRSGPQVPPEVVRDMLPRDASGSVMGQVQRPFLREKLLRQAAAFPWPALQRGLERVLAADLAFKGIEGDVDNPRMVLEMLVLDLASSRREQKKSAPPRELSHEPV